MTQMLGGKVGPHIQGIQYSRDNILPLMKQMGGRYAVIVNDWELCGMWLTSGGIPILRIKTPQYWDDDGDKNIVNPEAYADHVCNLLDAAEMHVPTDMKGKGMGHLGNELFTELPDRTDPWLAKGIRRFAARGRLCVVGNWAFLNRPRLNRMPLTIRALRDTGSFMGYHEGLYGDVWRAEDAITSGAIGGFRQEQAQYGFRVLITEFAASATPHDGWQVMFANRGGYKMWAQQIKKSLQLALQTATGVCLYSMPPWNEGRGFDYDSPDPANDEYKLRDELAVINKEFPVTITMPPPIVVVPDPLGEPAARVVNAARGLNQRAAPSATATVLRTLPNNTTVIAYPATADSSSPDSETWVYCKTTTGMDGWCANQYLSADTQVFGLRPPFRRYRITSAFNTPRDYPFAPTKKQLHEGLDFRDLDAEQYGTDAIVHVGAAGKVVKVGFDARGYGNYVIVDFGGSWFGWYAHLDEVYVKEGQSLKDFQIIGLMGNTGNSTGPHLHLTIQHIPQGLDGYVVEDVVDPATVLK